jgi:chemotaxis protein MotB
VRAGEEETRAHELVFIRRRGGGEEGEHKGGVWKIAYADFMTAMMAFFLVMWLINSTDERTLTQVANYFNPIRLTDKVPLPKGLQQSEVRGQTSEPTPAGGSKQRESKSAGTADSRKAKDSEDSLFRDPQAALAQIVREGDARPGREPASAQDRAEGSAAAGEAYRDPFEPYFRREAPTPRPQTPGSNSGTGESKDIDPSATGREPQSSPAVVREQDAERTAAEQIEADVKRAVGQLQPGMGPDIDVKATEDGLLVSLTDKYDFGMFAIASAEPRPATVLIMEKLANVLAARSEPLVVRGHTDGRPYKSATYDNWRLSTARAHMAYYMLVRGGIEESRFVRVEGHADRSLRIPGDPEAAQNRRIEILLLKAKT